jgi:hypothetical protein
MAKHAKRQNLKPPGKCIFCLRGATPGNPMTGEHLWADWMDRANLLPRGGEYYEFKSIFKGQRDATSIFRRTRQGSANTKKLKVVCKDCNGGWMGGLETRVQPYLTPLIKGESIVLDAKMRQTIIEWIVMKILVAEHNAYLGHSADPIFDQDARTKFYELANYPLRNSDLGCATKWKKMGNRISQTCDGARIYDDSSTATPTTWKTQKRTSSHLGNRKASHLPERRYRSERL